MRAIAYALIFLLFALSPALSTRLHPRQYEGGRSRDARDLALRNSSAAARMMGELRASTSDILFLKTERYLHAGVAYFAHDDEGATSLTAETAETGGDHEDHDGHEDSDHEHEPHDHGAHGAHTIIPTRDRDFRGLLGDLHRVVKPWRGPDEPHLIIEGSEIIPWYRLMTYADPTNSRAYAIGGWWLKDENVDEAIRFVEEGRRHNPDAFQLAYMLGRLYYQKEVTVSQSPDGRVRLTDNVRKSIELQKEAVRLGFAIRPPDGVSTPDMPWEDYQEEDLRAAARLAVILEGDYGDPEEALRIALEYFDRLGGDGILHKELEKLQAVPPEQESRESLDPGD